MSIADKATLNLNGAAITPRVIAIIVTMLEEHGEIEVTNGQVVVPGAAAMSLGMMLERAANLETK